MGLLVLMVAFPFVFTSSYVLRIAITVLMYIVLSLSLNLLIGYLGQMSMGHAAFWGIGAYTAAILSTRLNFSSLETFLCAMVIAGLFGLLLGLPVLKLKGYYLTHGPGGNRYSFCHPGGGGYDCVRADLRPEPSLSGWAALRYAADNRHPEGDRIPGVPFPGMPPGAHRGGCGQKRAGIFEIIVVR